MTERTELAASLAADAETARRRRPRWPWNATFELDRLETAVAEFTVQRTTRPDDRSLWAHRADAYLQMANDSRAEGRIDAAWAGLKAARREVIESFDATELALEAARLQREATAKLKGWRLEALIDLLRPVLAGQAVDEGGDPPPGTPRPPAAGEPAASQLLSLADARTRVKEASASSRRARTTSTASCASFDDTSPRLPWC